MIIWSGLGILIPLVAILGIVVGTVISGAVGYPVVGPGLGLALAAAGNWGLWKMIYPKQPKILVDPSNGQQVILNPKHGLFFIPAKAWTWILGILAVPMILLGAAGEGAAAKEAAKPGYKEFEAADKLIDSKSNGVTHGNSDAAKASAAGFSSSMKAMTDALFSGGSKKNLMTGGDFLTYCHDGPDTVVFLCHVPSLRSYKSEEAKDGLNKIAWGVASRAAAELDPEKKKNLMVGLRGIASYGSVMVGKSGDAQPSSPAVSDDKALLLPGFAPQ
ncbi:MAG: hypothetical protein MUF86_00220 [Akkermansiaceae bacterium]|nr:hypothetical protein [Akkermansiaceae bacterium]